MATTRRWRCLVCGFVAKGDEAPKSCPACGAEAEQFVRSDLLALGFARDLFKTFDPHPVSVHFSTGLIPVSAVLLFLWYMTGDTSYEITSFYILCIAVISLPVSAVTGFLDWRGRYGGRKLPVFKVKLALSIILMLIGFIAVALRYSAGAPTALYSLLVGAMFGLVLLLGHLGAKLVFYWKKELK